ncbi:MAG: hypothetical protein K0S33_1156 [Bacteroidetes bacterium]|jgi:hypothetical protein|nr:hypothetical protein [Bacteroidota bacterium]
MAWETPFFVFEELINPPVLWDRHVKLFFYFNSMHRAGLQIPRY